MLDTSVCLCYVLAMGDCGLVKARNVASHCGPLPPGKFTENAWTMNFMNFASGSRFFGPLEFTARHATSGPE
jgi:hypothetical protein